MAQNGSDLKGPAATGAAQDERTGVARPDSAVITVTPYSDDADSNSPSVETVPPAKPAAAIAAAASATKSFDGFEPQSGGGEADANG